MLPELKKVKGDMQETEIGALPQEWEAVKLGSLAERRRETIAPDEANGLIYVGLQHIDSGRPFLTRWGAPSDVKSTKHKFMPGDVLYGKLRPYLEKNVIAERSGICSTDIIVLKADEDMSAGFLNYLLHSENVLRHARATMTGVNHPRTSWRALGSLSIPLPPLPEQRAIARVLDTVQRAIQATERVIAAAQELKRSLMHHLFTYGPVPVQEAANVPLKETEIGPVPEAWEVSILNDLCEVKGGKRLPKGHDFSEGPTPYPYLRVRDFANGSIDRSDLQYLTPSDYERLQRYNISSDDVYISIAGTIGQVGTVPPDLDGANLTENAAKIIVRRQDRLLNRYLVYYLDSAKGWRQIDMRTTKTSQPKLAITRTRRIPLLLPPLPVQQRIAHILDTVQEYIVREDQRKNALQALFDSLLHNLMTGKIRVEPKDGDLEGAATAVRERSPAYQQEEMWDEE